MAPLYTGSLAPKKKSELQEIALALRISDQGTKDELVQRITKHLDSNQDALEENPTFSGLFGRRKRSVQPQTIPSSRFVPADLGEKPRSARRSNVLDAIKESTPTKDLRDVSTFLKHPFSPVDSTPNQSPRHVDPTTPSSLPPLPPSPSKSIIERLPKAAEVKAAVHFRQQEIFANGNELLISLRHFLSNSRNIWSVTSVVELFYILSAIIPWKKLQVPLSSSKGTYITINYPPLVAFQTSTLWLVLLHWALPTLILPAFIGCMITFNPSLAPKKSDPKRSPVAPLDPLTAAIIRLAAQFGYPYSAIALKSDLVGLDVLGPNWRTLSASVGLAFAFAEAIAGAPQVLADTIISEERSLIRRNNSYDDQYDEREATPSRRAIMAAAEENDGEVD